jgi:hypothetical protein
VIYAIELTNSRLPDLVVGLGLDAVVMFVIAYLVYFRRNRNAEYLFAFVIVNLLVFSASYMMTAVNLDAGIGFGLFALFSIMRFRTDAMPIQEMTYLFASFVVAAVNAIALSALSIAEVLVIDGGIITAVYALGYIWLGRKHQTHKVVYERIENIVPSRRHELLADLTLRTGLDIVDVDISQLNFLNDTAVITITARRNPHPTGPYADQVSLEEVMAVWSTRRAD